MARGEVLSKNGVLPEVATVVADGEYLGLEGITAWSQAVAGLPQQATVINREPSHPRTVPPTSSVTDGGNSRQL